MTSGGQLHSNIQNYNSGNGRTQRESRLLTTKQLQQQQQQQAQQQQHQQLHQSQQQQQQQQQQLGTAVSGGSGLTVKERLRGTSVSSNESVGEMTTRRSVRQSAASPLAAPAGSTRGASRSTIEDVNRRKTRSGAAGE